MIGENKFTLNTEGSLSLADPDPKGVLLVGDSAMAIVPADEAPSFMLMSDMKARPEMLMIVNDYGPTVVFHPGFMEKQAKLVGPVAVAVHCAIAYLASQSQDFSPAAISDVLGCHPLTVEAALKTLVEVGAIDL